MIFRYCHDYFATYCVVVTLLMCSLYWYVYPLWYTHIFYLRSNKMSKKYSTLSRKKKLTFFIIEKSFSGSTKSNKHENCNCIPKENTGLSSQSSFSLLTLNSVGLDLLPEIIYLTTLASCRYAAGSVMTWKHACRSCNYWELE